MVYVYYTELNSGEDAPWVFFKQEEMLCGQSKKLSGVVYHPSQSLFFHKARLAP